MSRLDKKESNQKCLKDNGPLKHSNFDKSKNHGSLHSDFGIPKNNISDQAAKPKSLLILISGGGSNMQAVFDAIKCGCLNAKVKAVVSSSHDAGGIERAKANNIPTYVCALNDFSCKEDRDKEILKIAKKYDTDYILTLGYLGICSPLLINVYPRRIINIHPALLPKYGGKGFFGLNVHRAVLEAGEKISGATVHYVDEGTDTGEIIMSRQVPVLEGDTAETLQKRVLDAEHILIVDALKKLINTENENKNEAVLTADKVHTTPLGVERLRRNLNLPDIDVVEWCKDIIVSADSIIKSGKNWYIKKGDIVITVNAYSHTIITARRLK